MHGQEKHRTLIIAVQTMKAALMKLCFERMYREEAPVFSAGQKTVSVSSGTANVAKSHTFTIEVKAKNIESLQCKTGWENKSIRIEK